MSAISSPCGRYRFRLGRDITVIVGKCTDRKAGDFHVVLEEQRQ